jgi:UDP-N-acetyl-alpha-D-muramoyl-L-alanyl-L-glutamate epimerase
MTREKRTIDPELLALNARGYLNGHTPFSAMLAFVSVLVAALQGSSRIALSNESSANESTVPGLPVNHQYSKTFEFESDFQRHVRSWITPDIHYFSLLRPVNELQITGLLCRHPQYLTDFRSCNVGSKQGVWCGQCAKCVFVAAMLSPFLEPGTVAQVFGVNPLDQMKLLPLLEQLTGLAETKPFECVGTVNEVRASLVLTAAHLHSPPALVAHMFTHHAALMPSIEQAQAHLHEWNSEHAVPPELLPILQREIASLTA